MFISKHKQTRLKSLTKTLRCFQLIEFANKIFKFGDFNQRAGKSRKSDALKFFNVPNVLKLPRTERNIEPTMKLAILQPWNFLKTTEKIKFWSLFMI